MKQTFRLLYSSPLQPALVRVPVHEMIASVEIGLSKTGEDVASEVRRKIANILNKARLPPSNLSPDEKRALGNEMVLSSFQQIKAEPQS